MKYVRVAWKHQHLDEPVILYSEVDDGRFEVRKVEVFRNGTYGYAGAHTCSGGTKLGIFAMPPLEEIANDRQFEPTEIEQDEFEQAWARALRS
jgi:hypothetical protein